MVKYQVRSNAFTRRGKPAVSVIEADTITHLPSGALAFLDVGGEILVIIQKDSWNDVVRIP